MTALDIALHAAERCAALAGYTNDYGALKHCTDARRARDRAAQCKRPDELARLVDEAERSYWRAENSVKSAVDYCVEVVGDDQAAKDAMAAARALAGVAAELAARARCYFLETRDFERKARELEQRAPLRVFRDARVHA